MKTCGELSTFRSLWKLLSGLVSTNATQILQACKTNGMWQKQILGNKQFDNHNKHDKNN